MLPKVQPLITSTYAFFYHNPYRRSNTVNKLGSHHGCFNSGLERVFPCASRNELPAFQLTNTKACKNLGTLQGSIPRSVGHSTCGRLTPRFGTIQIFLDKLVPTLTKIPSFVAEALTQNIFDFPHRWLI